MWPAWGAGMRRSDLSVDTKWWCWLVLDLSEIYVSDDWNLMIGFPFLTTEGAILEDVEGEINSTPSYSPLCSFNFVKQGFIL